MDSLSIPFIALVLALINGGIGLSGLWSKIPLEVRYIKVALNLAIILLYALGGYWFAALCFVILLGLELLLVFAALENNSSTSTTNVAPTPQLEEKVEFTRKVRCTNSECVNFGLELPPNSRFCNECGKAVEYTGKTTQL